MFLILTELNSQARLGFINIPIMGCLFAYFLAFEHLFSFSGENPVEMYSICWHFCFSWPLEGYSAIWLFMYHSITILESCWPWQYLQGSLFLWLWLLSSYQLYSCRAVNQLTTYLEGIYFESESLVLVEIGFIYKNGQLNFHLPLRCFPNYHLFWAVSGNGSIKNQTLLYSCEANRIITSREFRKTGLEIAERYQPVPGKDVPSEPCGRDCL